MIAPRGVQPLREMGLSFAGMTAIIAGLFPGRKRGKRGAGDAGDCKQFCHVSKADTRDDPGDGFERGAQRPAPESNGAIGVVRGAADNFLSEAAGRNRVSTKKYR